MNLLTDIWQQCNINPHAIAMREDQCTLSYQQLALKIGAVNQAIHKANIQAGSRIALAMDRGIDTACALLGIVSAGCCYIPLDINSPSQRRQFIIKDANISAVIGCGKQTQDYSEYHWLDYQSLSEHELQLSTCNSEQLAAILYTSGSTGSPKGVALSHRAILAFSNWAKQLVKLDHTDRIASLAPFYFDLSTFDLFASLSVGASIDFVPAQLPMAPSRLSAWLSQRDISGLYTVPSVLGFLALKGNLAQTLLPKLRFVLFAGEVFATPLLKSLIEYLPDTRFYNFYGPTETNVCLFWKVDQQCLQDKASIPIGHSACGNQLNVAAETGELLVKGPSLMSGYWSNGGLHSALSNDGWYATGDKVSINKVGEYCYHGRLDRMLKCSGFRVEPAEIEHALQRLPDVVACAAIGITDETAGQRPAVAVVLTADTTSIKQLRQALQQQIPAYMIPSRWKIISVMPQLTNGKIDYRAIKNLFGSSP
jgi:amino acid adenylation domain-containing protein